MTNTNPHYLIGLIWIGVIGPFLVLASALLWRFRMVYVIRARGKYMPQIHNFIFIVFLTYECVGVSLDNRDSDVLGPDAGGGCYLPLGFPLLLHCACTVVVCRVWVLLFRFRIAHALQVFHLKSPDDSTLAAQVLLNGPDSWFIHRRYLITRQAQVIGFLASMTLVVVCISPIVAMSADCQTRRRNFVLFSGLLVIPWAVLIYVVTRLFRPDDQDIFGIRKDLRASMNVALITLLVVFALFFSGDSDALRTASDTLTINGITWAWVCNIAWPLWAAYQAEKGESGLTGIEDVATLADLLSIDIGYESFLSYAKLEFAQENVLFWKAVRDFRVKYSNASKAVLHRDEFIADATVLLRNYIWEHSPSQINISAEVRNRVVRTFEQHVGTDATVVVPASPSTPLSPNSTGSPVSSNSPSSPVSPDLSSPAAGSAATSIPVGSLVRESLTVTLTPPVVHVHERNDSNTSNSSQSSVSTTGSVLPAATPINAGLLRADVPLSSDVAQAVTSEVHVQTQALTFGADILLAFQAVSDEIYGLMVNDILNRYIRSDQFVQFVKHMKELEQHRQRRYSQPDRSQHSRADPGKHSPEYSQGPQKYVAVPLDCLELPQPTPIQSRRSSSALPTAVMDSPARGTTGSPAPASHVLNPSTMSSPSRSMSASPGLGPMQRDRHYSERVLLLDLNLGTALEAKMVPVDKIIIDETGAKSVLLPAK